MQKFQHKTKTEKKAEQFRIITRIHFRIYFCCFVFTVYIFCSKFIFRLLHNFLNLIDFKLFKIDILMDESEENHRGNRGKIKDLVAFWIFGLCNNYGYVVMLTAAEDIINSKIVS